MLTNRFHQAMQRFAPFEPSPHLAVAVSGGADSRALALLAQSWVNSSGGMVTALVIDHGLRPESLGEAQETVNWLHSQTIHAHLLPVKVATDGNLQEAARVVRYAAMLAWCQAHGVLHLLLGHHHDDQVETLLQRVIRGSGVDGLGGMEALAYRNDVRLLRPLLCMTKVELTEYLSSLQHSFIHDASNDSPNYLRNRLRLMTPHLAQEGLTATALMETSERLHATSDHLKNQTAQFLAESAQVSAAGFMRLNRTAFVGAPREMAVRALRQSLITVRGSTKSPRYHEVLRLQKAMIAPEFRGATLHGCRVLSAKHSLWICREHPAPPLRLDGGHQRWDDRFALVAKDLVAKDGQLTIAALGAAGLQQWRQSNHRLPDAHPAALLHSFPALWQLERCVSVPHMGYGATCEELGVQVKFSPRKPLC